MEMHKARCNMKKLAFSTLRRSYFILSTEVFIKNIDNAVIIHILPIVEFRISKPQVFFSELSVKSELENDHFNRRRVCAYRSTN